MSIKDFLYQKLAGECLKMLLKRFQKHIKLIFLSLNTISFENAVKNILMNLNVLRIISRVISCSRMSKNVFKCLLTLLKNLYLSTVIG